MNMKRDLKKELNLPLSASLHAHGNNISCAVSYKDLAGKQKVKWLSTGFPVGTSDRVLYKKVKELVNEFYDELMKERYTPSDEQTSGSGTINEANNAFSDCSDIKFHKVIDEWLQYKVSRKDLANSTLTDYKNKNEIIKSYFPADLALKDLKTSHILSFYDDRYEKGNNGTTVRKFHVQIGAILRYAVKREYIYKNVLPDSEDAPRKSDFKANFCTHEELMKVIDFFKGDRMELPLIMTVYYGFRRSEICGLKWSAVDFENNTITINHIMTNSFNGCEQCVGVDRCKSKKSQRTLPLIEDVKILLLEKKEREEKYRVLCGDSWDTEFEGYVCRDDTGKLITPDFISEHFRYVIRKNGFKKMRFHDLRHSCASFLLKKKIQMKQIQEWLGHSSFAVTADLYSHLDAESKQETGEALRGAFSKNF